MQGPERAVEYYMNNNNELPNKETTFQIKRHSDHIKPTCSIIAMWEVKLYTHALRTPFDLMAKRTGEGESGLPQKRLRCQNPSPFRGGGYGCSRYLRWLDRLFKTPTKCYDLFRRRRFFGAGSLSTWISLWSLESHFLYLQFCHRLFSHVAA